MSYILKAHVNFSSAVPELLRGLKGSQAANPAVRKLPGNVEGQHELSEVDCAAAIRVECSEDDLTKLVCAAPRKYFVVHLNKLSLSQLAVGAILHKANMPFLR